MLNQRPKDSRKRFRGMLSLFLGIVLLQAFLLGACSGSEPEKEKAAPPAQAKETTPAQVNRKNLPDPIVDESFSIRLDEELFQLEEAVTLIATSLSKVASRTPTLAINSIHFGKNIKVDFRRKAEVIILDKVFVANPNVRLVQCQECRRIKTRIVGNVLKITKGIPSQEARQALAKKIGVNGFIDIGIFQDGHQLTVYIKVVEAESGAIILVDELVGRRAPKRLAFTISFGELIFPITDNGTAGEYKALALSMTETVRLTGRFSFSVDLILFMDNNENDSSLTYELDTGILIVPTLGFEIIQMPSSTTRLIFFSGVGKLLSPQLSYANAFRLGLELVVGDRLSVLFAFNQFLEESVEATTSGQTATIDGSGYEIRFGFRF